MALIKFNDLAASEALDRKAMRSIQGALCWVNDAFPCWIAPVAFPGSVNEFNFLQINNYSWQQTTNNYTTIGQAITSGPNSTNTGVLLGSTSMLSSTNTHG